MQGEWTGHFTVQRMQAGKAVAVFLLPPRPLGAVLPIRGCLAWLCAACMYTYPVYRVLSADSIYRRAGQELSPTAASGCVSLGACNLGTRRPACGTNPANSFRLFTTRADGASGICKFRVGTAQREISIARGIGQVVNRQWQAIDLRCYGTVGLVTQRPR